MIATLTAALLSGCSEGKFDRAPEADAKETAAMTERYQAFVAEAKNLKAGDELTLLHHFSEAALTAVSPEVFKQQAAAFVGEAAGGKLDSLAIRGGKSPGKARLLLVALPGGKVAVPFVQSADGWKLDDVEIGFGNLQKEHNINGATPASPPSPLAAMAVFQDAGASAADRVGAALSLAEAKDRASSEKFAAAEKDPWAKTALLYAAWKAGADCAPFAAGFPMETKQQAEMYDNDSDAFRTLLVGLADCAAAGDKLDQVLKVYRGCHEVDAGPRSEYVDPVIALGNAKPLLMLQASLKAGYKYDEDPVANILVGALHGETKAAFVVFLTEHAKGKGASATLAGDWLAKMGERDKAEPANPDAPPAQ